MGSQVSILANRVEKGQLGYQAISLTNFAATTAPSIVAGSKIECSGALYEFNSNEAAASGWAGIGNNTAVYMYLVPSGSTSTWIYSSTVPTWNTAKQGWYNGGNRCFGGTQKDNAAGYSNKWLANDSQESLRGVASLPIGTILMFDANASAGGQGGASGAWTDGVTMSGWYACIAANSVFACPDMTSRFAMGKVVAGAGALGGNASNQVTIASGNLPTHTHTLSAHTHTGGSSATIATPSAGSFPISQNGASGGPSSDTTGNGGFANTALSILPLNYSMIFIRRSF